MTLALVYFLFILNIYGETPPVIIFLTYILHTTNWTSITPIKGVRKALGHMAVLPMSPWSCRFSLFKLYILSLQHFILYLRRCLSFEQLLIFELSPYLFIQLLLSPSHLFYICCVPLLLLWREQYKSGTFFGNIFCAKLDLVLVLGSFQKFGYKCGRLPQICWQMLVCVNKCWANQGFQNDLAGFSFNRKFSDIPKES